MEAVNKLCVLDKGARVGAVDKVCVLDKGARVGAVDKVSFLEGSKWRQSINSVS
jgi:hypothetical protein